MLLQPELLMFSGPPPQSVLDQRPMWLVLIGFLTITLLLRIICLDLLGSLLCGLVIFLAIILVKDGMKEMSKFSLVFSLLCAVNAVFYFLPLVSLILNGRTSRQVERPELRFPSLHHIAQHFTYTLTVKATPMFDLSRGVLYNLQSVGDIAMPLVMLSGGVLGFTTHQEFENHMSEFLMDDDEEIQAHLAISGAIASHAAQHADGDRRRGDYGALGGGASAGPKAFQGKAHKLAP